MTPFEKTDFHISTSSEDPTEVRIVKIDTQAAPVISEFAFRALKAPGQGSYEKNKAKFGPIAATDPERAGRPQKDRRFSLNPLVREPLSVEEEERRVIEEKVRARIDAMADEAKAEAAAVGYEDGLEKGYQEA